MKTTMKRIVTLTMVLGSLLLSGCASSLMRPGSAQQAAAPEATNAKIVFMRSSVVASAIGVDMFEVINGDLKFIGQLPTGNKIVYETTPGKKVFMAYGTAADFMTADVAGGKTYYSIVRPNWGTGGFAPTPIRNDGTSEYNMKSKDFRDWLSSTKPIEPNDDAQPWFTTNKARYQDLYKDYWARFQKKNDQEKAERMLRPEDGVTKPF
jgi:hypothetical protein